jgi:hypothetical protein
LAAERRRLAGRSVRVTVARKMKLTKGYQRDHEGEERLL